VALSPKTARTLNVEKCKNELCSSRTELNRMFVCLRRWQYMYVVCSLSADAESELMRMERVHSETSRRISQLQQQLSDHQLSCSDEEEEEEEEEEQTVGLCISTLNTVM